MNEIEGIAKHSAASQDLFVCVARTFNMRSTLFKNF